MGKMKATLEEAYEQTTNADQEYPLAEWYDPVTKPKHYTQGRTYEPIDVIKDWELGFCLGNALKYISRAGRKDSKKQDLEKALFYIQKELDYGNE
jgi:hypothetical protein